MLVVDLDVDVVRADCSWFCRLSVLNLVSTLKNSKSRCSESRSSRKASLSPRILSIVRAIESMSGIAATNFSTR